MMLAFPIRKQLAPFEQRQVHGTAVGANPKLARDTGLVVAPSGTIEGDVAKAMTAKNHGAPRSFSDRQRHLITNSV